MQNRKRLESALASDIYFTLTNLYSALIFGGKDYVVYEMYFSCGLMMIAAATVGLYSSNIISISYLMDFIHGLNWIYKYD